MANRWGKSGNSDRFSFLSSKITVDSDCSHEIKIHLLLGRKATKVHLVKAIIFPVVMYGSESWTIKSWAMKNWCFWTMVLEKTLESPLDSKEIQPVHPKGNQSWIFIGRTDAEASILLPPDAKNWLLRKDPDAGKGWRQEEKGMTEYEMVGWHQWLDGHEFEQALRVGDGQGSLACCSPWGCRIRHYCETWLIDCRTFRGNEEHRVS